MGKGGGCVPSKKKISKSTSQNPPPIPSGEPDSTTNDADSVTERSIDSLLPANTQNLKLFIIFYSMYGHVESLARRMKKGLKLWKVLMQFFIGYPKAETLYEEVLVQMQAPMKDDSIPKIPSLYELADTDGFLFGFPTRYECMAVQMEAFFDSTGQLWSEQKLAGKPAEFFISTRTQGGGQETNAWTTITQLARHGMLFVPIGYTFGAGMFKMDSIRGGSSYGAGVFAGDGTRETSDTKLAFAEHQGIYMAAVVKKPVHN